MGNFINANNELDLVEKLNEKSLKQNKKYLIPGAIEVYRASQIMRMRNLSEKKLRKAMQAHPKPYD